MTMIWVKRVEAQIVHEKINGRHFTNNRGETVYIGFSNNAEEAIGLPFEVFEKQQAEIESLQYKFRKADFINQCMTAQRNDALEKRDQLRSRIARLSFKDRVKVFFTILFGTLVLQDIVGIK